MLRRTKLDTSDFNTCASARERTWGPSFDLDQCGDHFRVGELLKNPGRKAPVDTLPDMSNGGSIPHAELLQRRMAAMGLSAEAIASREPELFQNLRISCAACEHPDLCALDLRSSPFPPECRGMPVGWSWDDYCPNAALLNALSESCRFRLLA